MKYGFRLCGMNYSSKEDYTHGLLSERESFSVTNFVHSLPEFWAKGKSLHYMPMHPVRGGGGGIAPAHS